MKWISVFDQHPEKDINVLFLLRDQVHSGYCMTPEYSSLKMFWYDTCCTYYHDGKDNPNEIKYWMSMDDIPKPEDIE